MDTRASFEWTHALHLSGHANLRNLSFYDLTFFIESRMGKHRRIACIRCHKESDSRRTSQQDMCFKCAGDGEISVRKMVSDKFESASNCPRTKAKAMTVVNLG